MKNKPAKGLFLVLTFSFALFFSCHRSYTPKPRGFFRIDFPERKYKVYQSDCPYSFEYPVYAKVVSDKEMNSEPCWINIEFPEYNGKIHISYKPIQQNLNLLLEDSYTLAYKHTVKADAIEEHLINKPEEKVYGILYDIEGNAASSVQFFVTDSTKHFLRGALYFRTTIDKDSLAPVIRFFREDILHFIDTFEWTEPS
jgi:gliding motility-associated lipoprotein GldD